MTSSLIIDSSDGSYAAYNRNEEWRKCCANAMGFEWVNEFEEENNDNERKGNDDDDNQKEEEIKPIQQVINLLNDDDNSDNEYDYIEDDDYYYEENDDLDVDERTGKHDKSSSTAVSSSGAFDVLPTHDHWTENARRIQQDMARMTQWIHDKQYSFISVEMDDEEASLIQSTVTSYAATTAGELETLREMIKSTSNIASHRAGIVQILFAQLQEDIIQPFGKLQKQRTRKAVQLWQNPLQCRLYQPQQVKSSRNNTSSSNDSEQKMMELFDEQDEVEREQRFLPRRKQPQQPKDETLDDFYSTYVPSLSESDKTGEKRTLPNRPQFMFELTAKNTGRDVKGPTSFSNDNIRNEKQRMTALRPAIQHPSSCGSDLLPQHESQPMMINQDDYNRQMEEDLHQEAALLTVSVQNDLDSVQKMEQRMVEITTLISTFSNLVVEQQEHITEIHDSAETTKKNMEKGQENLVDATERTKRSKHRMAWSIVAMAMVLLFFHTLKA